MASAKKKPFLADPKFLKYKGFRVCDEADNGIQLWYYPFDENVELPKFKECAKQPYIEEKGYVLYYTSQCPFNAKYVHVIEDIAKDIEVGKVYDGKVTRIMNFGAFVDLGVAGKEGLLHRKNSYRGKENVNHNQ